MPTTDRARRGRVRMSASQRREQLIELARGLFATKGFEGTSVEEIAAAADVSKPVVYDHFGGKEGLYAVVVDREVRMLGDAVRGALTTPGTSPRLLIEQATLALLDYIEARPDGFRILTRDSGPGNPAGSFASILSDVASQAEDLLAEAFAERGLDPSTAPLYAQALVGTVALTGQWWLDARSPGKEEVAAHLVNLAWYGLKNMEPQPRLKSPVAASATTPRRARRGGA